MSFDRARIVGYHICYHDVARTWCWKLSIFFMDVLCSAYHSFGFGLGMVHIMFMVLKKRFGIIETS